MNRTIQNNGSGIVLNISITMNGPASFSWRWIYHLMQICAHYTVHIDWHMRVFFFTLLGPIQYASQYSQAGFAKPVGTGLVRPVPGTQTGPVPTLKPCPWRTGRFFWTVGTGLPTVLLTLLTSAQLWNCLETPSIQSFKHERKGAKIKINYCALAHKLGITPNWDCC
jgi:hypothetical protein